jgi:hypothetical protein
MAEGTDKKNIRGNSNKISRNLEGLSDRAKKSRLTISDLIIPIGAGVILLLLTLFVFMPMISTAQEYRKELKRIEEDIEHLDNVKSSLEAIDDTQLIDDLVIAKKIIPRILQVSDFVYYIDNLAESKNLTTSDISAGDINVGSESEETRSNQGVSSSLSYKGEYDNVLDFIDELQGYSPYLVTLKGVELSMVGGDNWSVDFQLTGYYVPERERSVDFLRPFTKYTNFSDIIDIFSVKVEKLDEI